MNSRQWALFCSVVHFGLSNLSTKGTPARPETVIEAARKFEAYLDEEQPDEDHAVA